MTLIYTHKIKLYYTPVHPMISHCLFEHPLNTNTPIQGHATALYKT